VSLPVVLPACWAVPALAAVVDEPELGAADVMPVTPSARPAARAVPAAHRQHAGYEQASSSWCSAKAERLMT